METTPVCFLIGLLVVCFTLFCFLSQLLFNIYTERLEAQMSYFLCHKDAMQETLVQLLGWEDLQEKRKATHSSILAWRIPWTGSQRVGND